MKFNKKFMLVVGMCMVISLTACATQTGNKMSLFERGLDLINEVDKLAENEEYIKFIAHDDEIFSAIQDIAAKDYKTPKVVFAIDELDELYELYLTLLQDEDYTLSDNVKAIVKDRFVNTVPSLINAQGGVKTAIQASATVGRSKNFIYKGLEAAKIYIYTFDSEYNFMVSFIPGDENIVTAFASAIINEDIAKCTTTDQVKEFLKTEIGFENANVSLVTK